MSRPDLMSGKVLGGRYRIDELLGQGGMSSVYKAFDPNLKRVVAVKMIHSHLASDPKFVSRFEEEAAAVAQLRHPNIVQVFDFNHDEDLYYMVQEFVPGETLQERLRRLKVAHLVIETAFSDEERALARISSHLCPSSLGHELLQLEGSVAVHITHIKPGEVEAVMGQIEALGSRHRITALASGQVIVMGHAST